MEKEKSWPPPELPWPKPPVTASEFIKTIDSLTVYELNTLVKALEAHYSATAATAEGIGTTGNSGPMVIEEQTGFSVILKDVGDKKINVIKEVRAITGLGLKEAKDLVEAAPQVVKSGISKSEAADFKSKIESTGATAEVK